jgi:transposase InsO family protein
MWSMDYKGWFRVGDGTRCDPLTVNDVCSRASLVLRAMVGPKLPDVKRKLEEAFHEYGLPDHMLSDNGPPFASAGGLGRLSRLSVWLLRLGVMPVLIEPGHPEQNGRHERYHETLKAETASPPKATVRAQQGAFDRFRPVYNEQRPHEALGMRVPAEVYEPSQRQMPAKLPEHEYPAGFEVRCVRPNGTIRWTGDTPFVGEALAVRSGYMGDSFVRAHG